MTVADALATLRSALPNGYPRAALARVEDEIARLEQERETANQMGYSAGYAEGRKAAEAEVARLGALYSCGYATGKGQNCGKCQQCLTVHEHFLKEACKQHKAELARLRDGLQKITGPNPYYDPDGQHDYGYENEPPRAFAPAWVRDIANDLLVDRALLAEDGAERTKENT